MVDIFSYCFQLFNPSTFQPFNFKAGADLQSVPRSSYISFRLAPITNRRHRCLSTFQPFNSSTFQPFLLFILSFGRYDISAGILLIAFEGQVLAIEQSLQFTQRLCFICIYKDPFPKSAQPFTHFAHPSHISSFMVYSK